MKELITAELVARLVVIIGSGCRNGEVGNLLNKADTTVSKTPAIYRSASTSNRAAEAHHPLLVTEAAPHGRDY